MINYAELIRGGIEVVLIIFLYVLAKRDGKNKAEKSQLIETLKGKDFYDRQMDARVSRVEATHEDWKQYVNSLDFNNLTDYDIQQLREGKTIGSDTTRPEFDTKPDKESAD